MKININDKSWGKEFKGLGMVSGNNSSRLLMDYKYEQPEKYREILKHIFGKDGLNITHLKLEMGSDINSSSGTEPCVKRNRSEAADVTRGAGYILAADAKKINPELTVDMLYWSEPKWVTDSDDVYDARYIWYKDTLTAAYEKFGLEFDCVSVSRNERDIDSEWIKYFVKRIKAEKDCPYDFSKIRIVAADEENAWWIADRMLSDDELCKAVDIIGSHYTSHSTEKARKLSDEYGKELWFTEGCAPMSYSAGTSRFDGCGLTGTNGVLDIANRIIAMYPCGGMTMYEFQPVAAGYYDGVTYCHKQLITANEPWSGHYTLDSGYYMAMHFSRYIKKGWKFIDAACCFDGEKDGHSLVNAVYSCMTAADIRTGDYSVVIANSTDKPLAYEISVSGLLKADADVAMIKTSKHGSGSYDENYFVYDRTITPVKNGDAYSYTVEVMPFSLLTLTTLSSDIPEKKQSISKVLSLPYSDDFSYSESYVAERGGMPRYTTDQGGAFEVTSLDGRNVLMQRITPSEKAMEWGETPLPTTNFGDDRWFDYSVSADVFLTDSDVPDENYIGIGLRFSAACLGRSGYSMMIHENGTWKFGRGKETVLTGSYQHRSGMVHSIKISADNECVSGYIDGCAVFEYKADMTKEALMGGGRAALYSSYNRNYFERIDIQPIGDEPYISRYDDTDSCFEYSGGWEHRLMSGFSDYKRTVSCGKAGDSLRMTFDGTGFGIFGANGEPCEITAAIDGKAAENIKLPVSGSRELFICRYGMEKCRHTVEITVIYGTLSVDGVEIQ